MTGPANFPPNNDVRGVMVETLKQIRRGNFPWWYPEGARGKAIDYFVYGTDFDTLAASATETNNVNISGDSAFCVLSAVIVESDIADTTFLAVPPLLVRIQDSGSGRYLSNTAIHASNWFGTAQEPKYWDIPKIFAPNSTLTIEVQNLEATERVVRMALHGFKIFNFIP